MVSPAVATIMQMEAIARGEQPGESNESQGGSWAEARGGTGRLGRE